MSDFILNYAEVINNGHGYCCLGNTSPWYLGTTSFCCVINNEPGCCCLCSPLSRVLRAHLVFMFFIIFYFLLLLLCPLTTPPYSVFKFVRVSP